METGAVLRVVLVLMSVLVARGKIVHLNGSEIVTRFGPRTTVPPALPSLHKWSHVFNAGNISNHSGMRDKEDMVVRKNDQQETDLEVIDETEDSNNGTMANRSARQMSLFTMQRVLNGMHLLALLGGIYLMIFVVDPVAVPPEYLEQHFFGVPWSAERRTNQILPSGHSHQYTDEKTLYGVRREDAWKTKVKNDSVSLPSGHINTRPPYKSAPLRRHHWHSWMTQNTTNPKSLQQNSSHRTAHLQNNSASWSPIIHANQRRPDAKKRNENNTEERVFVSTGKVRPISLTAM